MIQCICNQGLHEWAEVAMRCNCCVSSMVERSRWFESSSPDHIIRRRPHAGGYIMREVINDLLKQIEDMKDEKKTLEGAEELVMIGKIIGMQEAVIKLLEVE